MQFFDRLAELERTRATFAVATVVGRRSPVSSHLGDRAVIYADGRMEGFVGGSCSRDIVRRHGLAAIGRGMPCLLHIRPELAQDESRDAGDGENIFVPMACASEGAVDVYIEPHVPLRSLIVVGFTPVADALARMAASLDYKVVRVLDDEELRDAGRAGEAQLSLDALPRYLASLEPLEASRIVAVVASQGHYDESALEALLGVEVAFVGLLASRKRAASVFGVLRQQGATAEQLARIRNPVGLDIGACNPAEVAVSILAEIIAQTPPMTARAHDGIASVIGSVVDPVCGMEVDPATTRYRMDFAAHAYVFCGAGCRAAFAARPQQYLAAAQTS